MQQQEFTLEEFRNALRAEAASQNVRMHEPTLDAYTTDVFTKANGQVVRVLLTTTFPIYVITFIEELQYVARMEAIARASARRVTKPSAQYAYEIAYRDMRR